MRLTAYSDYSLRLLMYAALKSPALVTIQEVADIYGISKNHLMKIAFDLGPGTARRSAPSFCAGAT